LIFQWTLPWQPIKVEKSAFFPDQSTLSRCHSETDCNIAIPISKGSIHANDGAVPYFPICVQKTLPWQTNNLAVMKAN